jgi:hypothetical protein
MTAIVDASGRRHVPVVLLDVVEVLGCRSSGTTGRRKQVRRTCIPKLGAGPAGAVAKFRLKQVSGPVRGRGVQLRPWPSCSWRPVPIVPGTSDRPASVGRRAFHHRRRRQCLLLPGACCRRGPCCRRGLCAAARCPARLPLSVCRRRRPSCPRALPPLPPCHRHRSRRAPHKPRRNRTLFAGES